MKSPHSDLAQVIRGRSGFTLTEMMMTLGIFSFLVVGILYSHLLGLKMNTVVETKLRASHNARAALNSTSDEIRSARRVYVGIGGPLGFTNAPDNSAQQGN